MLTALFAVAVAVTLVAFYTRYLGGNVGATVTSWWRSPFRNAKVGGTPGSLHVLGWAVDLVPATSDVETAAREQGFRVVVNEGDHIHASWFRA